MADDIIRAFLDRLALFAPPAEVHRTERELRQAFGGDKVYVAKESAALKTRALAESLAAGASLREAFNTAGVGRSTGYRLLARRWHR